MPTMLKSSQAQQNFGALIDQVLAEGEVVVERYGTPRVAMIDYRRYQQLLASEQELWRARLQQASQQASARAAHLGEEEIDALIEEARAAVQPVGIMP
ncbi:MAG: type II toxin-antitoxin system Phd/YefM family antitoxin [Caldilineales bacterium]|nr:type II toxin-antitoxin system Phd/YefM family antitoxin [Caldilineales bacterium]MCW5858423.1 type II toxin-antitoxin system Phd/YefM family antitoxin [Caldilineales bacterium]